MTFANNVDLSCLPPTAKQLTVIGLFDINILVCPRIEMGILHLQLFVFSCSWATNSQPVSFIAIFKTLPLEMISYSKSMKMQRSGTGTT